VSEINFDGFFEAMKRERESEKQILANFKFLESTAWNQAKEIERLRSNIKKMESIAEQKTAIAVERWARINELEQQLDAKPKESEGVVSTTLLDVMWKENDHLQEDVKRLEQENRQLHANALAMDSLANKAREVIDQSIGRTRELEIELLRHEVQLGIRRIMANDRLDRIKQLERQLEARDAALRDVRDTPQERHEEFWHLTNRLRQIAQKALEEQ
jgi:hypothetical protein